MGRFGFAAPGAGAMWNTITRSDVRWPATARGAAPLAEKNSSSRRSVPGFGCTITFGSKVRRMTRLPSRSLCAPRRTGQMPSQAPPRTSETGLSSTGSTPDHDAAAQRLAHVLVGREVEFVAAQEFLMMKYQRSGDGSLRS